MNHDLGPEYPIEGVRNALASLERAYWELISERDQYREGLHELAEHYDEVVSHIAHKALGLVE